MSARPSRSILILLESADWPADLLPLVQALQEQGACVTVRPCAEPYADVLDSVEGADTVLTWR